MIKTTKEEDISKALMAIGKPEVAEAIGRGFTKLHQAIESGKLDDAVNKLTATSTLQLPFQAALQAIIASFASNTAEQSAQTMMAMLELIKSDAVQAAIQKIADIFNKILSWISDITQKVRNAREEMAQLQAEQDVGAGEFTDNMQEKPWWWPPWTPWVPSPVQPTNPTFGDGSQ